MLSPSGFDSTTDSAKAMVCWEGRFGAPESLSATAGEIIAMVSAVRPSLIAMDIGNLMK